MCVKNDISPVKVFNVDHRQDCPSSAVDKESYVGGG